MYKACLVLYIPCCDLPGINHHLFKDVSHPCLFYLRALNGLVLHELETQTLSRVEIFISGWRQESSSTRKPDLGYQLSVQ